MPDLAAVRHPDEPFGEASDTGPGRRIPFQRVPEPKPAGKNRPHLSPGTARRRSPAWESLDAALVREVTQQGSWTAMTDPKATNSASTDPGHPARAILAGFAESDAKDSTN